MKSMNTATLLLGGLVAWGGAACVGAGADDDEIATTLSPLTTTYQAESAVTLEEGVVESIHAGFTGTGYVNIDNFSSTFMVHVVNTGFAGAATLRVRYANGTGTNRPIQITVNGVNAGTVTGAPTGAWTTWATASVPINLIAGNNDVVHSSVVSAGMPNIDKFEIVQSVTQTFQAEAAFDVDEGVRESIHPGFTGTGYVNINNFSNTFMWHIVNSPVAASVTLTVRYANGTSSNRPIHLSVNGGNGGTLTGAPTGSWSTWVTASLPITLDAGDNDVVHSSVVSEGMPNIDKFDLTW